MEDYDSISIGYDKIIYTMLDYQIFPFIAIIMTLLLLAGIFFLRQMKRKPGAVYLLLLFVSIMGWLITNTFELVDPTVTGTLFWGKFSYIFICVTPVIWLYFILDYYGHTRLLHHPVTSILWLIPIIGLVLVFTNDLHYLFWKSYSFIPVGDYLAFKVEHGSAYFVFWIYECALCLTGLVMVGKVTITGSKLYRWQSGWIFTGGVIVLLLNLIYISKIFSWWQKDYTSVALAIGVIFFLIAIFKYQLFQVVPVRKSVLFDALDDGVMVVDRDNIVVSINHIAQKLLDINEDEVIGKKIGTVCPAIPEIADVLNLIGEGWQNICLNSSPPQYIMVKSNPIHDSFQHNMLQIRDSTSEVLLQLAEKEERQFALALSEIAAALNSIRNLDDLLDLIIKNVVLVTSCDSANIMLINNDYAYVVRSLGPFMDWSQMPIEGTANFKWMVDNRKPMAMPDLDDFPDWVVVPKTEWIRSHVGAPIVMMDSVIGIINLDSSIPGFYDQKTAERLMSFAHHVSIAMQNARIYKELEELATIDDLTGIDNRRQFFTLATREFNRAQRYVRPLTAVMLDLDNFKSINDQYGHIMGDMVLRRVAQTCLSEIREMDVLGRYGGEEFAMLLTETSLNEGALVAERIRERIAQLDFEVVDGSCQVTASLGVAELDATCLQLIDLLDHCDKAMYRAKAQGRNGVVTVSLEQDTLL